MVKTIALYLPQFHRVIENDAWWGEGFTDWVSASNAKPLFSGHSQPHIPENNNYYDLLNPETIAWQAQKAKEAGIFGFAFYHYYFGNGRKILEKPAELLLQHKEIGINFCFDWANESWVRTWSVLEEGANVWFDVDRENPSNLMPRIAQSETRYLLRQDYGDEEEYKKHFAYLLPFFKDERYIKKDNRPVFIIYQPSLIWCMEEMAMCWNKLAQKAGFDGIYLIGESQNPMDAVHPACNAKVMRFPDSYFQFVDKEGINPLRWSYEKLSKSAVAVESLVSDTLDTDISVNYISFGPGIDTTPRRGNRGIVLTENDPAIFGKYFRDILHIANARENEFVFLNAWNEWGEGMYLEPDEETGDKRIMECWNVVNDVGLWENVTSSVDEEYKSVFYKKILIDKMRIAERDKIVTVLLDSILDIRDAGFNIGDLLYRRGFKHIGIYGYGRMGQRIAKEIEESSASVDFIIDSNSSVHFSKGRIVSPEEKIPQADLIIISPVGLFHELSNIICDKVTCPIVSSENLIRELKNACVGNEDYK